VSVVPIIAMSVLMSINRPTSSDDTVVLVSDKGVIVPAVILLLINVNIIEILLIKTINNDLHY